MNLDLDFFQVSKLSEDQKKGFYQKWNTFPEYVHHSQIIGGDADEGYTQILGGYIPPFPPEFQHPRMLQFHGICFKIIFANVKSSFIHRSFMGWNI